MSKPLDAGLAERLAKIWMDTTDAEIDKRSIPEWGEVDDKKKRKETLTATEEFVLENEPADPKQASVFREQLLAVIKQAAVTERNRKEQ